MKLPARAKLALAILTLLQSGHAFAAPAIVDLFVFDGAKPLPDVSAHVAGAPVAKAGANGGVRLTLDPGEYEIDAQRAGASLLTLPIRVQDGEQIQVSAAMVAGRAPVYRIISSISGERIVDSAPAPTPISSAPISSQLAAAAAGKRKKAPRPDTMEGVTVEAGIAEQEGGQFEATEERREAAQVGEIISAEQISRAGDSDTASALKRVTGLTVVNRKYIYVRGLGERYSSVLLNGAQIPSPDPTRRVVPLDLIPTDIISSVAVQKAYSADMPGEFGGGTVQLRTKGYPDEPLLRVSGTLAYVDGTSFASGYDYDGGDQDWSGRDDGARDLPDALDQLRQEGRFLRRQSPAIPDGFTPQQLEAVGEQIAGVYDIDRKKFGPNGDLAASGGRSWQIGDEWTLGLLASARYSNVADTFEEQRRYFVASDAGLEQRDDLNLRGTETEIDLSSFVAAGVKYGEGQSLRTVSTLLRQTTDEARVTTGIQDNQSFEAFKLEWIENSLRVNQLIGEHALPFANGASFDWMYTDAQARRYSPDTREYRFDFRGEDRLLNDRHSMVFADLEDDSQSWDLGLNLPLRTRGDIGADLSLHAGTLDRDRDSYIRRYLFGFRGASQAILTQPSVEDIFTDANIGPGGFQLDEITTPTDTYTAQQSLDYRAVSFDLNLHEKVRLNFGLRQEDNAQTVTTFSVVNPNLPPIVGGIDQTDHLPALAATWWIAPEQQLRFGYSETVSRPDFRELSASPYLDPVLDLITFGNPDLKQAEIKNYDLRWEYYFSPLESFSVALFRKDFTNPIEKQLLPGAGSLLLTLANAQGATNQGIEFDIYKELGFLGETFADRPWAKALGLDRMQWDDWFVAANYAWIDSTIELDPMQSGFNTNLSRPLEGQSPYALNLQGGFRALDGTREATLLYNISGERIVQVGVDGQPDTYEQPFGQLDFTWKEQLSDGWSFKVRMRNLLDPKVEFQQTDDAVLREYRRGRGIAFTLEWSPKW